MYLLRTIINTRDVSTTQEHIRRLVKPIGKPLHICKEDQMRATELINVIVSINGTTDNFLVCACKLSLRRSGLELLCRKFLERMLYRFLFEHLKFSSGYAIFF